MGKVKTCPHFCFLCNCLFPVPKPQGTPSLFCCDAGDGLTKGNKAVVGLGDVHQPRDQGQQQRVPAGGSQTERVRQTGRQAHMQAERGRERSSRIGTHDIHIIIHMNATAHTHARTPGLLKDPHECPAQMLKIWASRKKGWWLTPPLPQ